jgi:predicted Zn-dependent protease
MNGPLIITSKTGPFSRRDFLRAATAASAYVITGCATNPVTGESQLMLVDQKDEIEMDRANSPHQISADYGASSDNLLREYVSHVGNRLSSLSHRPDMPYSYRVVDATYMNAYAFPGGTISATRGIMLALDNEASLAALMGHEIGHVNARHTAARMSAAILTQIAVAGLVVVAASQDKNAGALAAGLGALGAGALLAKYSRDDERQADGLGMEYMTKAGYNPQGMVDLMDVLRSMSREKPSALEMMFASHPMSDERYQTAAGKLADQYSGMEAFNIGKQRHMDSTSSLRRIKPAIEAMQRGEEGMRKRQYRPAEEQYSAALKSAPNDYAGLLMMAKCQLAQKNPAAAQNYAERARQVKPSEPQSNNLVGMAKLFRKDFGGAFQAFSQYEKALPGNPNTVFFKGLSAEGMGDRARAAEEYSRYVKADDSTEQGKYAASRLLSWGYLKRGN